MSVIVGLERTLPDQRKKQRSFQESPLLSKGTLKLLFSQAPNLFGAKTLSPELVEGPKGQGGKYGQS